MENNELIKYEGGLIKRVGNVISVTNKLLASIEPQLIPYRKGDKWGFCTPDKKIVIDCLFDDVRFFYDGLAVVKYNDKYGYIDKKGRKIIPFRFDKAYSFYKGEAQVGINNVIYYIDKNQKLLFTQGEKILFNHNKKINSTEITRKCIDEKWGFKKGDHIFIKCKYDEVNNFSKYSPLASVKIDNKWGFIDKNGKVIIPFIYNSAGYFSNELANVCTGDKHGFINKNNNIIIPFIYDDAYSFHDDLASVKFNGKYGFIDIKGAIILDFIYDYAFSFSRGLANVDLNNRSGYINKQGIQYWED